MPADKTLSPYFVVDNADPGVDALPLKSTDVKVRVLGVIAEVVVTQQYTNTGTVPLEARYVFPASTRAAVHAMNVRLGDRLITAEHPREGRSRGPNTTRRSSEGKTAALLEQHRANVFQMHVGNILPGDDVRVELAYTELLVPTDGVYRFVYPTVVGPRYNGAPGQREPSARALDRDTVPQAGRRRRTQDSRSPSRWNLRCRCVRSLRRVTTWSSTANATRKASVTLQPDGEPADDRDFVLEYRLDGDTIQSGVLLSDGPGEKFFLAMVQPPATVPATTIVPREYVFIVDVSGSMHGFPLDTTRALMRDLLPRLRPSDTFNLLLFSGDNRVLAPRSIPATAENVRPGARRARRRVRRRWHRDAAGAARGARDAERPGPLASVRRDHGRLRLGRARALRPGAAQPLAGQPVRVRHWLVGQPCA